MSKYIYDIETLSFCFEVELFDTLEIYAMSFGEHSERGSPLKITNLCGKWGSALLFLTPGILVHQ
jgi:hypothetical protein